MANILNTIYPPLIDTFMPAFPIPKSSEDENPKITFSISPFNDYTQIKKIHVSIIKQKTNLNAIKTSGSLNSTFIWQNIWIVPTDNNSYCNYDATSGMYVLTIPKEILKKDWEVEEFYKIQLRFDTSTESIENNMYLINYSEYFSEWSRVCLIKIIEPIDIYLVNFDEYKENESQYWTNAGTLPIAGHITFDGKRTSKSKEYLQSYQIIIYETAHPEEILDQTKIIYTGNLADQNNINTLMDCTAGKIDVDYSIKISITTKNQYKFTKVYKDILRFLNYADFDLNPEWIYNTVSIFNNIPQEQYNEEKNIFNLDTDSDANASVSKKIITEEDGIVDFTIKSTNDKLSSGYLYIRRASSLDNFKKWELVSCTHEKAPTNDSPINVRIQDPTVGSLVLYQYSAQYENVNESLGQIYKSEFIYPNFHDILLYRNDKQLALRLNSVIQNPKPNVNRQKIDTLGGKYPKFAENAQMDYKSFTISAYLDAESDYNRKFLNDADYYKGTFPIPSNTQNLDTYNFGEMNVYNYYMGGKYEIRNDTIADSDFSDLINNNIPMFTNIVKNTYHDIYPKDNWWWQRKFRQEAVKWLNDGEPKLFRSMTEGNIVVMLTDINLAPLQQLGRRTYQLTCTAYEVADGYDLDTLVALGIYNIQNDKISSDDNDIDYELSEISGIGQFLSLNLSRFKDQEASLFTNTMFKNYNNLNELDYYNYNSLETRLKDWFYEKDSVNSLDGRSGNILGQSWDYINGSLRMKDVKIFFESEPHYYYLDDNDLQLVDNTEVTDLYSRGFNYDDLITGENQKDKGIGLGYKIKILIDTSINNKKTEKWVTIFVNNRGYYQIPSNLSVKNLILCDGVTATVEYKYAFNIRFNSDILAKESKIEKKIVSQISGYWTSNVYINNLIQQKHSFVKYKENGKIDALEKVINWNAMTLETQPYSIVKIISSENDTSNNNLIVGRSGILNLGDNYSIYDMAIIGKRMVQVSEERQPYLDEWEFVLDDTAKNAINNIDDEHESLFWQTVSLKNNSTENQENVQQSKQSTDIPVSIVTFYTNDGRNTDNINAYWNNYELTSQNIIQYTTNLKKIQNPKYNTVYAIENNAEGEAKFSYYIYYLDDNWYEVQFEGSMQEENNIIIAKIPLYGVLTYRAQLLLQTF